MCKICVFAGTTEGRTLAEFLCAQNVQVTACVATEYGETLMQPGENLHVSAQRLTEEQMKARFLSEQFDLVVDATHPYAPIVTENIAAACQETKTEYLRLLRDGSDAPEDAVFAESIEEAVSYLNGTEGTILLTTGSKELSKYTDLRDFTERVYARVLPMEDSLRLCQAAGLKPSHILAMQGPFSREMNVAMLRSVGAAYMVTKLSGSTGGYDEKVAAARQAGAKLVVIGRPPQRQGLSYPETLELLCSRFHLNWKPQVTVVGIGPGDRAAMTGEVLEAISQADVVIGAKRMLESICDDRKPVLDAIAPAAIADFIHNHMEYRHFVVAMSGDVGFFSGTKKLLPLLADCDVTVLPGISSLVCLCAKLGTSYEDVVPVSAHGRDRSIVPQIRRRPRVFTLVGGENGMGKLCRELTDAGMGEVRLSVGERLSYPEERITVGTAQELADQTFQSLAVALIENPRAVVTFGLPDEAFLRGQGSDGVVPMTKSEVRAVCLSKLQLTEDACCWDIGAGTGSVSIEMALQAGKGRVYAVERREEAVELMESNARKFGTDHLHIVSGTAPEACENLPAPTHVFIGGSAGNMREILSLILSKNPKARIVATAIALESVGELTQCMTAFPFTETEVVSLTVARGRKAGRYHLMNGQNPIYIFTMQGGELT